VKERNSTSSRTTSIAAASYKKGGAKKKEKKEGDVCFTLFLVLVEERGRGRSARAPSIFVSRRRGEKGERKAEEEKKTFAPLLLSLFWQKGKGEERKDFLPQPSYIAKKSEWGKKGGRRIHQLI